MASSVGRQASSKKHYVVHCVWVTLLCLLAVTRAAATTGDYDPKSDAWNGLQRLLQLAVDIKVPLIIQPHLVLDEIEPGSGILLLAPESKLPRRSLANFMREGGRVGLLDDQGSGAGLLQAFHIRREALTLAADTPMLRGNPNLPIAQPSSDHPLTYGVAGLVTNHPQSLVHDHLEPVLTIQPNGQALALSGAVGAGRLIAVADASILINNMLTFDGNQRFAQNLLRYLSGEERGPVYLVIGADSIVAAGQPRSEGDAIARMRQRLRQLIAHPLPRQAVMSAAWIIAIGLLLAAAISLPRPALGAQERRPEIHDEPRKDSPSKSARYHRANCAAPLQAYSHEWHHALRTALRLPEESDHADVMASLAGYPASLGIAVDRLLRDLQRYAAQEKVSRRRFRRLVSVGHSILSELASGGADEHRAH